MEKDFFAILKLYHLQLCLTLLVSLSSLLYFIYFLFFSSNVSNHVFTTLFPFPILQDGIFLPYENVLNYDSFAVRIGEDDIPNLINILRVKLFLI